MRWTPGKRSDDLEDRRGQRTGFGLPGGRGLGLGGMAILLVLSLVFRKDFFSLLGAGGGAAASQDAGPVTASPEEEEGSRLCLVRPGQRADHLAGNPHPGRDAI